VVTRIADAGSFTKFQEGRAEIEGSYCSSQEREIHGASSSRAGQLRVLVTYSVLRYKCETQVVI